MTEEQRIDLQKQLIELQENSFEVAVRFGVIMDILNETGICTLDNFNRKVAQLGAVFDQCREDDKNDNSPE